MTRKPLCWLLTLLLCVGTVAGALAQDIPDYINLDGYIPLAKEGNDAKLSVGIVVNTNYNENPTERWYWTMLKEVMNLNVEITQVTNKDEYVTLTFAADDLPDLMIGVALKPTQLVTYGQIEGQLLDLSQYVSPELTPRLAEVFEAYPDIKAGITLPNGAIYAFPYVTDPFLPTIYSAHSVNKTMMEKAGVAMPKTLDGFVDLLYAFKALGEDVVPLGGGYEAKNPGNILLQALGYETMDAQGLSICLRNGEVVLPGADETYRAYLTLMKQFYQDGIVDPDFYTLDDVTIASQAAGELLGVMGTATDGFTADPKIFQQYTTLAPITSDASEKAVAVKNNYYTAGGAVVSAKTQYPELIMRWADWMMTNEGTHAAWVGPHKDNTALMLDGWGGWYLTESYSRMDVDREKEPSRWEGAVAYLCQRVAGFNMGSIGWVIDEDVYRQRMSGLALRDRRDVWREDPNNAAYYWRADAMAALQDIAAVDINNLLFFFDEETSEHMAELSSVILSYIESESAKFVTGVRPLEEFDAYRSELESLDVETYVGYYAQAYASYLENMK